jgi:hypothetical protein
MVFLAEYTHAVARGGETVVDPAAARPAAPFMRRGQMLAQPYNHD